VPQFIAVKGITTLGSVISPMRFGIHAGSGKGYKEVKECANKVKQCCEVCRKHSQYFAQNTRNNLQQPLTSWIVAIDACVTFY